MVALRRQPSAGPTKRMAFTLVELVASMAVMGILLGASASIMLITSHATPRLENPVGALLANSQALDQLARDLSCALEVSEHERNAITLTVPDRGHGNAGPESIRYAWAGGVGDPLTREYNGSKPVSIVGHAHEFRLDYDLKKVDQVMPVSEAESAQTELISHEASADLVDFSVLTNEWIGQYFLPSLPDGATSWCVLRIKIMAKQEGKIDGTTRVQLQLADESRLPSGTVLDEALMKELDLLGSYAWQEFSFTKAVDLSPDQGLCLVVLAADKEPSCAVQYKDEDATVANSGLLRYADGSWSITQTMGLQFYVYGQYKVSQQSALDTSTRITRVGIELEAGEPQAVRAITGVNMLNQPRWE
jgi:type II secretory pathway pseudopilin PulG